MHTESDLKLDITLRLVPEAPLAAMAEAAEANGAGPSSSTDQAASEAEHLKNEANQTFKGILCSHAHPAWALREKQKAGLCTLARLLWQINEVGLVD